jgi:hypothetical protein
MLSSLLTFVIIGVIAVIGISIVLAVLGAVFGLALGLAKFLLFTVAPLALIGYVVLRFFASKNRRLSKADRDWIES